MGAPGTAPSPTKYTGREGEALNKRLSSYPTWEYHLIRTLGGTPNLVNLEALDIWAQHEGMPTGTNNWLATTDPNNWYGKPGSSSAVDNYGQPGNAVKPGYWNTSPGVVTYPTMSAGVNGTAAFLRAGYQPIIDALINPNSTLKSIGTTIATSGTWKSDGLAIAAANASSGAIYNPPPVYTGGSTTGPNAGTSRPGQGKSTFTNCNSANTIIGGGGLGVHWNILNVCQAKALAGGLVVGLGGVLMVAGLIIVATGAVAKSPLAQAAGAVASPAKKVGGLFGGSSSTPAPPPAPSEQPFIYGGHTIALSPQQAAYRREKGDSALTTAFDRQRASGARA